MRDTAVPHTVAGCLCTPQDLLAVDCGYPGELAEGDHIVFFNSGAYGPSASPPEYPLLWRLTLALTEKSGDGRFSLLNRSKSGLKH
jgi:hypothetical protein